MKVAICISGVCRGELDRNLCRLSKALPFDMFFGTWRGKRHRITHNLPGPLFLFDEPEMHYHPITDVDESLLFSPKLLWYRENLARASPEKKERTLHHTKQILAHGSLLRELPADYDMIVRARYDTFVGSQVDFLPLLHESYNKSIAIGFGTRCTRHNQLDVLSEVPRRFPYNNSISQDWWKYLMDPLIFHPRNLFNNDLAESLHKDKKLLVAENGWYQILGEPFGDTHRCFYGGAQIEKYLYETVFTK